MLVTALAGDDQAQPDAYDAREHYTKYEYRIPMRDGVKLFTSVYATAFDCSQPC